MMSITQLLKLPGQSPSIKRLLKSRLQRSVKIRCCGAAVNKEIRASNKRAFIAHQQLCHIGHLIGGSRAACRAFDKHVLIKVSPGAVKFVQSQRCNNNSGRNRVDPSPFLAPFYRLSHDPLFIAAFRQLVSVKGISDIFRPFPGSASSQLPYSLSFQLI